MQNVENFSAFDGKNLFAAGTFSEVTQAVRKRWASSPDCQILVFSQTTGRQTDIDPTATDNDFGQNRPHTPSVGRPKLGVIGREVTLLPRHWEWLNSQSGGASVALRKLVEMAMRENAEKDNIRLRHEAAYKFMTAIAGDLSGYEEALRSLFANDREGLQSHIGEWPDDVKCFAMALAFPSQVEERSPAATA